MTPVLMCLYSFSDKFFKNMTRNTVFILWSMLDSNYCQRSRLWLVRELKVIKLLIKHLAKTFLFCFIFSILKPNQKDLADLVKCIKLWVKHQNPY
jgi:hypothetical protein